MKTIHKYTLAMHFGMRQHHMLPRGATILTIDVQHGQAQLWALVDPSEPREGRTFYMIGTGQSFGEDARSALHIATVQDGPFVWHWFEVPQ